MLCNLLKYASVTITLKQSTPSEFLLLEASMREGLLLMAQTHLQSWWREV